MPRAGSPPVAIHSQRRNRYENRSEEIIAWLEETVAGWNAEPTPFVWEGKRWERRNRARHRLLGGSAAIAQYQLFAA